MTDLISLLEAESKAQQEHPNKPFVKINNVQIVYDVCLNTEKLIRVIANTMQDRLRIRPSINYAMQGITF